jgi:phosphoribosyl-dephospho-CoA transferase
MSKTQIVKIYGKKLNRLNKDYEAISEQLKFCRTTGDEYMILSVTADKDKIKALINEIENFIELLNK